MAVRLIRCIYEEISTFLNSDPLLHSTYRLVALFLAIYDLREC